MADKKLEDFSVLYLSGRIDDTKAEDIARKLLELNLRGGDDAIQLIINSPGGFLQEGFALVDLMELSRRPVRTTGVGTLCSAGLLLFMAGEKGHRLLTPNVALMSHQYSWGGFGRYSELVARRKEQDLTQARLLAHYKRHTKLKTDREVSKHLMREVDTWLSPREALTLGIADRIEHTLGAKASRSKKPSLY